MKWINNYTGEIYKTLGEAIVTIFEDMKYYKACRTVKMFDIKKID